jgi:hypothetical protein
MPGGAFRYGAIAVAGLAAFTLPGAALGQGTVKPVSANLDGDPALEQVVTKEVCISPASGAGVSSCGAGEFPQRQIVVQDTCNGTPYSRPISSQQDLVITLKVANFVDITPRPEIFFDLRSGASGHAGEIRLISWQDSRTATACPQPRDLFRYPARWTLGRVPRHAKSHDTFDTTFRDVTKRYAGREIRLRETYVDANDALCCPSFERTTWFGYSAGKDLYVRFRTHVKRIKK